MSGSTSSKKVSDLVLQTYKPSEIAQMIHALNKAQRPLFVWGKPGIAKSAVSMSVATSLGIAFADVRLSQVDPTDLRGMPYPVIENGVHYMAWSAPEVLPRDLDIIVERETKFPVSMMIHFPVANPLGSNGIHYVTDIGFTVAAHDPNTIAVILDSGFTHVEIGIFAKDAEGNRTGAMIPGGVHLTIKGKARGIIAYEEFNSAPPAVQAASYQLILDRRLGQYVVPAGCYQMAMGNTEDVGGITFKMGWPLRSRFVHAEMRHDFEEWYEYAIRSGHAASVVSYLDAFNDQLFQFDKNSKSMNFQCPRTWSMASDIVINNPEGEVSDNVLLGLFIGAVGDAGAYQFDEHRKIAKKLPKAELILSGQIKKLDERPEIALSYALTATLCYKLNERADAIKRLGADWKKTKERAEWLQQADNFLMFVQTNFSPEIAIMGVRRAIATHKLPFDLQKMKNFNVFAEKFKDIIVS